MGEILAKGVLEMTIENENYHRRVRQLEELNKTLRAEVERMRPVAQAAIDMKEHGCGQCEAALEIAVAAYESSKS